MNIFVELSLISNIKNTAIDLSRYIISVHLDLLAHIIETICTAVPVCTLNWLCIPCCMNMVGCSITLFK